MLDSGRVSGGYPSVNPDLGALIESLFGTRVDVADFDVSRANMLYILHNPRKREGFVIGTAEHTGNNFLSKIHLHQKKLEEQGYTAHLAVIQGDFNYAGIAYGILHKEGAD